MSTHESVSTQSLAPRDLLSGNNSQLFINRELSWIKFNQRVLEEARRITTPLLERVKFLGILSSNVDEFYMKRLGGLKHKIAEGGENYSIDGLSPSEQLEQCRSALRALQVEKEQICQSVLDQLKNHDVEICRYTSLSDTEKAFLHDDYLERIDPLITPFEIDLTKPFPFIANLSLYLIASIRRPSDDATHLVLIKLPSEAGLSRFVQIEKSNRFVLIEDIIAAHIGNQLPRTEIVSVDTFRVTRSAVSYRDYSELDDLREIIEEELYDRRFASVVRLQVSPAMSPGIRRSLAINLGLGHQGDIYESCELLRMSDLRELASLNLPHLRDDQHRPATSAALANQVSILAAIQSHSCIVLQHPYESFSHSVEGFVREASEDPDVISIKMTLYRTSAATRIVDYLMAAAASGKKVSVVVELKARFDEASNLRWTRQLESAGVEVCHGIAGLKTHCKCILVVKRDQDKLRRYAHVGTGNYHAGTAQIYSDIGLLTCNEELTADISKLFKYLTNYKPSEPQFNQIMATPHTIKKTLLDKIDREITMHSDASQGYICLKTNALEDPDITLSLYRASQAGVKVDLIVRDICRLSPGVAGVSDNIRVISIVGRFLEHSRLYRFRNGGEEELYMGSADLMTRNLERRVELLIPVIDAQSKQALIAILDRNLRDNCCAWEMRADGTYNMKETGRDSKLINSQNPIEVTDAHAGFEHRNIDTQEKLSQQAIESKLVEPFRIF